MFKNSSLAHEYEYLVLEYLVLVAYVHGSHMYARAGGSGGLNLALFLECVRI